MVYIVLHLQSRTSSGVGTALNGEWAYPKRQKRMSDSHHHRSLFKEPNRPFKGKSKGKAKHSSKGKVESNSARNAATDVTARRTDRVHRNKQVRFISFVAVCSYGSSPPSFSSLTHTSGRVSSQLQQQKRHELLSKARLCGRHGAPTLVALVALNELASTAQLKRTLISFALSQAGTIESSEQHHRTVQSHMAGAHASAGAACVPDAFTLYNHPRVTTVSLPVDKRTHRFSFFETPRDPMAVLDIAKVRKKIFFFFSLLLVLLLPSLSLSVSLFLPPFSLLPFHLPLDFIRVAAPSCPFLK